MAFFRLLDVARQFGDSNDDPLSGGKIYTYAAGTTTNKATYEDSGGVTAHSNPIILGSDGRIPAEVWGTTGAYKLRIDDANDVTIRTSDNIAGINDTASSATSEWIDSALTPTFVGASSFTLVGDQTSTFHVGRRIKIVDSGGTDYGTITASSYSDPNTTLTIALDSGSIDSGISAISYGLISKVNSSISSPPERVAFHATPSVGQVIATGTDTTVILATETYDKGGNFASNTFTAPGDGIYLLTAGLDFSDSLSDNDSVTVFFYKNGTTTIAVEAQVQGGSGQPKITLCWQGELDASDTVVFRVNHNYGSNRTLAAADRVFFAGCQLA